MNLSIPAGVYSTQSFTASTDRRDVSELIDLWAHTETPFLNKLMWGPESGATKIEWLDEHLGFGYVECSAAIATSGTTFVIASLSARYTAAELAKQISPGCLLHATGAGGEQSGSHAWMAVSTIGSSYTVTFAFLSSTTASIAASTKLYIVANFANEGSEPDRDTSRVRRLLSNHMAILRKDVRITGTQENTDMYGVSNETTHQVQNRLLAMQFERERAVLYGWHQDRSGTAAGMLYGMAELLLAESANSFVDDSTTTLTEAAFNNAVADMVDNGGRPDVIVGSVAQIRKFTAWDKDRIRVTNDNQIGGSYVTKYLTDTGVEMELIHLKKAIPNFLFMLDTSQIQLIPKKNRKLIMEKLGKKGDYEEWQMISEFSAETRGIGDGKHGMFSVLT